MAPTFAVLIDGGFVKHLLRKKPGPPITHADIERLIAAIKQAECVRDMRLHRVYFYDARPLTGQVTRPDGSFIDFTNSKLAQTSHAQHAAIAQLPYVAMRFGELSFKGWGVKQRVLRGAKAVTAIKPEDLEPNVQQKGVDMRIGLDVAALALKKQANVIVLVTADSDLVPAMKLARREGAQLVLVTLGSNVKDAMRDHADVVIDLPTSKFITAN